MLYNLVDTWNHYSLVPSPQVTLFEQNLYENLHAQLFGFFMRFLSGTGEQFREKLQMFPKYYATVFSSAPILVVVMDDHNVAAACCITRLSNSVIMYVKKLYRRKGLGTRLEWTTICQARKQGRNFVIGALSLSNVPALRIVYKLGYREIVRISGYERIVMMIPFNVKGEAVYAFFRRLFLMFTFILPEIFLAYAIRFLKDTVEWAHG